MLATPLALLDHAPVAPRTPVVNLRRQGAWILIGRLAAIAAAFGSNLLLARQAPLSDYGGYVLAASVVFMTSAVFRIGLHQSVVKLVAEQLATGSRPQARGALWRCILLAATSSVAAFALLSLLGGPILRVLGVETQGHTLALTVAVWSGCETLRSVTAEAFRGLGRIGLATAFGDGPRNVLLLVALALAAMASVPTVLVASQMAALSGAVVVVASMGALWATAGRPRDAFLERGKFGPLLRLTIPLGLASMGTAVFQQADVWILGALRDPGEVAVYGAAYRVAAIMGTVAIVLNALLAPRIVELYARKQLPELQSLLRSTASVAVVPIAVATGILGAAGPSLLAATFGEDFRSGGTVLFVLALSHMVTVGTGLSVITLAMTGHQRFLLLSTLISVTAMILVSILLGNIWGMEGVACGVLVGLVSQNSMTVWACWSKLHVATWAYFAPREYPRVLRRVLALNRTARPK